VGIVIPTKKEKYWHKFKVWIGAWLGLIDEVIMLLTFAFWCPYLQWKYMAWDIERQSRKAKEKWNHKSS
jgi:hypothetical protein